MRRLLTTTIASLTLAAPLLMSGAATAQAPSPLEIKPGKLARGADISVPHVEGTTIVDGGIRIKVNAKRVLLYGKWNEAYIASLGNAQWGNVRLVRVAKNGAVKVLREGIDPFNAILDAEADQVAYSFGEATQKPTIEVYDLGLKDEVTARGFDSLPTLLEYDEGLVVGSFAEFKVRTFTWDTVAEHVEVLNKKQGNYASKAHDLLGFYSKDPQNGGCQVLARLSDPTDRLWTNCDERIEAVSTDGKRVATVALLSDGIGPADIGLRSINGKQLAHYTIKGWFGEVSFETPQALLMQANGKTQSAVVRCVVTVCDRASDLEPTPDLRALARSAG
jgi:hypothetical protein